MAKLGDINPNTGQPYSPRQIEQINQGLMPPDPGVAYHAAHAAATEAAIAGDTTVAPPEEYGFTTPTTPTPTVEEQLALMPETPTPIAPTLTPVPAVTPAPAIGKIPIVPLPEITPTPAIGEIPVVTMPEVAPIPGIAPPPTVPTAEITPAPEYAPSIDQKEFQVMYGAEIQEVIDQRGIGIPEATQHLMIQKEVEMIRAREDESLRVMKNNMERRQITNSGLVFSEAQKIRSAGTVALANVIRDVTIKDALMKMASYENAMGRAGQFLGYLAEESKTAYQGELLSWQVETAAEQARWEMQTRSNLAAWEATVTSQMAEWQVKNQFTLTVYEAKQQMETLRWQAKTAATQSMWEMQQQFKLMGWKTQQEITTMQWEAITAADQAQWEMQNQWNYAGWNMQQQFTLAAWEQQNQLYQIQIGQAYAQDNIEIAHQLTIQQQNDQQAHEIEMAEMEDEAANQAAATTGFWGFLGTIVGIFLPFLF